MDDSKKKILVVEDEKSISDIIRYNLEKEGFSVYAAYDGEEALTKQAVLDPDLLLLDVMLPKMDGFTVCKKVREKSAVPIIILTAKEEEVDKVLGLELGADDYMEKPVDAEILIAKVKALMQRAYGGRQESDLIVSGQISLDTSARQVYLNGRELELNVKEYELLLLFLENPGKTLRKEYIFAQIWGMDSLSENQTLTVHIKMLRSKIEDNPRQPGRIQTVWGVGYRYEEV